MFFNGGAGKLFVYKMRNLTLMYLLFIASANCFLMNTIRNSGSSDDPFVRDHHRAEQQLKRFLDLKKDGISSYLQRNGGGSQSTFQRRSMEFMIHVFEKLLHGKDVPEAVGHRGGRQLTEIRHSDTIRCLSAKEGTNVGRLSFTIPEIADHETLKMAEVRFKFGNGTIIQPRSKVLINIRHGRRIMHSMKLNTKRGRRTNFDITRDVLSNIQRFRRNITVEVKYRLKSDILNRSTYAASSNNYSDLPVPVMILYSQDKSFLQNVYKTLSSIENVDHESDLNATHRQKRSADNSERKRRRRRRKNKWRKNEKCQLHDFKVDFDLLGWGRYIIHPKTFNAKVCYGQCPSPISQEYTPTNHAVLQTLMKMKRPLVAPEPCCVPTKLRPLSMLYFEYDAVVVRHHQGMVAAECGCR